MVQVEGGLLVVHVAGGLLVDRPEASSVDVAGDSDSLDIIARAPGVLE